MSVKHIIVCVYSAIPSHCKGT